MGNNLLAVNSANHTRTHTVELSSSTGRIEAIGTVNTKMEYFAVEGTSWQEVTEASKNLFDKTAVKTGCYVDATGAEIASTPWNIAIIPLQPGKSIAITVDYQGAAPKYCFYNPSGELLLSTQDTVVPVPNGTSYAKISVHTNDLDTFMLEYGEKQTDYEPYCPASPSAESPSPIQSLEDFSVVVHGRNILDWQGAIDYNRWHTTSLDDDHPYGYYPYLIVDGFVPGLTYTIAADGIPALGTADLYCHLGTYPGGNKGQANWMYHKTASALCKSVRTFVATESVYYLNCSGCKADTVSRVIREWLPHLRIYQGSYTADTVPPYTPYYRQNVHIPFALRAVGDVKDQLAVDQKAKKVTVTRRVDPEKIDPTQSIYDNPEQYLLDPPVVEDVTDTQVGRELLQLASCYPETIVEIQCANGLTGQVTAQIKVLGR